MSKLFPKAIQKLSEPEDRYILDVQLGRLTQAQYDGIRKSLGAQSKVPFNATKDYSLVDFLAPFAQAVVNQTFKTINLDTSKVEAYRDRHPDETGELYPIIKNGIGSLTNCWNTSMEYLRSVHPSFPGTVYLYWPGRWQADEQLKSNDNSTAVTSANVRPGDVILFSQKQYGSGEYMLQHTAIVISKNLVFEKTDGKDEDPYRVALLSDVVQKYKRLLEADIKIQYRRFNKKILPGAYDGDTGGSIFEPYTLAMFKAVFPTLNVKTLGCETVMGGGCDIVHSQIFEAKVITNPRTGRGILYAPESLLKRFTGL